MRIEAPDERIVESIEDAVAWLRRVQLHGVRVQRIPAPETDYGNHTENFDIVVVADDAVPPIWARHYEIESDRPVFAGRDAIKRYSLNEIERERRTGTPWYGNWPTELIEREYPLWRKKVLGGSLPP
jgi:PelA/Pel-15E family pectate lyase